MKYNALDKKSACFSLDFYVKRGYLTFVRIIPVHYFTITNLSIINPQIFLSKRLLDR